MGSRKQKSLPRSIVERKRVWGKLLKFLKLSFPISNIGIKITVKFLWTTEFKYLTHLMLNKWQSFLKETTYFFRLHFSWGNFHFIPRKEQYLWLCGYLSAYKARSSYLYRFSVHLYFSRGGLPFDLGGQSWIPMSTFFWVRFRWWVLLFSYGLLFLILLTCALYIHVFLPYLYVLSFPLQQDSLL